MPIRAFDISEDGCLYQVNYQGRLSCFYLDRINEGPFRDHYIYQGIVESVRYYKQQLLISGAAFEGQASFSALLYHLADGSRSYLSGHVDDLCDSIFLLDQLNELIGYATSSLDGSVNLYSKTGKCTTKITIGSYISQLQQNPVTKELMAVMADDSIGIINIKTGILIHQIYSEVDTVGSVWSSDGQSLIVCNDGGSLLKYQIDLNHISKVQEISLEDRLKSITHVPDSSVVALVSYGNILYLFDYSTNKLISQSQLDMRSWGYRVLAYKDMFITASFTEHCTVYKSDLKGNLDLIHSSFESIPGFNHLHLSSDQVYLSSDDGYIYVVNLLKYEIVDRISMQQNSIVMNTQVSQTEYIVSLSFDGSLYLLDYKTKQVFDHKHLGINGLSLYLDKTNNTLALSTYSAEVWVFQIVKFDNQFKFGAHCSHKLTEHLYDVTCKSLVFNDDRLYVADNHGFVHILEYLDNSLSLLDNYKTGCALINQIIPLGTSKLCTVQRDMTISIYDIQSKHLTQKVSDNHCRSIKSIAYSSKHKLIATGSYDRTIQIHSESLNTVSPPLRSANSGISSVSFHDDLNVLIAVSYDGYFMVWDIESHALKLQISPSEFKLYGHDKNE